MDADQGGAAGAPIEGGLEIAPLPKSNAVSAPTRTFCRSGTDPLFRNSEVEQLEFDTMRAKWVQHLDNLTLG